MNWDLIIGLIVGLSGSIMTLIGTIVANKQNHKHELETIKQNHELEKDLIRQNHEQEMQLSIQKFTLENSFKEYELRTKLGEEINALGEESVKLYPYDMYLVSYMKIAEYLSNDEKDSESLSILLWDMSLIKGKYNEYN